jgi:DNA-binding transcriptional LysR family regulator
MNIHHLELFYYVARHGGISQAVRKMPYGIQQPAISGQILHLEHYLGTTLFQRTLTGRGLEWPTSIEVSSLDLVATYVAHGFGMGLSVEVPGVRLPAGVQKHRLAAFPAVAVGALWRGALSQVAQGLLRLLESRATQLKAEFAAASAPAGTASC